MFSMSTPLHAAYNNGRVEAVKLLLELGANPLFKNPCHNTVFYKSLYQGNVQMCRLFLESGVDANTGIDSGLQPLALASSNELVDLLLEFGAKLDKLNNGHSVLYNSITWGDRHRQRYGASYDLLIYSYERNVPSYLIHRGAVFSEKDFDFSLSSSNLTMFPEYVKPFIERNRSRLNVRVNGETQFERIKTWCPDECLELFMKGGLNPNLVGKDESYPLHRFTEQKESGKVEILLKYGANVNSQDKEGNTALMIARDSYFHKGVKILLKYGANAYIRNKAGGSVLSPRYPCCSDCDRRIAKAKYNPGNCCIS